MPVSDRSLANLIRWKPGQTGNPGGYSRSRRVSNALNSLIDEKSADRALAIVWLKQALAGNPVFFRELLDRLEGKVTDRGETVRHKYDIRIIGGDDERRDPNDPDRRPGDEATGEVLEEPGEG